MILSRQTLVVPDGTGTRRPPKVYLTWPEGSDVTVPVAVVHSDGTAYDLSGAVACVLAFKESDSIDEDPVLNLEWTITDDAAGEAEFYVVRGDIATIPAGSYVVGFQFRDDDTDFEDSISDVSNATITPRIGDFAVDVTVQPTQAPLARGPAGVAAPKARTVAVTNVASLSGAQTVNGTALVAGDDVLLTAQTTGTENGVWTVGSGAWSRSSSMAAGSHGAAVGVFVSEGTLHANSLWVCTNAKGSDVVGTDALTFARRLPITATTPLAIDASNNLTVATGSTGSTVCIGNDSRLSDARTPTAHATSHVTGGSDVIANAVAGGAAGLMTGADKTKLDASSTDAAFIDAQHTWTKSQNVAEVALVDGASIATDASLGNTFYVTLGGNRTLANPTNLVAGGTYQWVITQDGTGSRTLAFGSAFKFPSGVAPTLTTAAGSVDVITAVYRGSILIATASLDHR